MAILPKIVIKDRKIKIVGIILIVLGTLSITLSPYTLYFYYLPLIILISMGIDNIRIISRVFSKDLWNKNGFNKDCCYYIKFSSTQVLNSVIKWLRKSRAEFYMFYFIGDILPFPEEKEIVRRLISENEKKRLSQNLWEQPFYI